jgi:hypothetical protein
MYNNKNVINDFECTNNLFSEKTTVSHSLIHNFKNLTDSEFTDLTDSEFTNLTDSEFTNLTDSEISNLTDFEFKNYINSGLTIYEYYSDNETNINTDFTSQFEENSFLKELTCKIQNLENQIEWIDIYNSLDKYIIYVLDYEKDLTKCKKSYNDDFDAIFYQLDYFFLECCRNKFFNICEFIFRRVHQCEFSIDICKKMIENYGFSASIKSEKNIQIQYWVNYVFHNHFLNCNFDEKEELVNLLIENSILLHKYFYIFLEYYLSCTKKFSTFFLKNIFGCINNSCDEYSFFKLLKHINLSKNEIFKDNKNIKFSLIFIFYKVYRYQFSTGEWMNLFKNELYIENANMCILLDMLFIDNQNYFIENLVEICEYDTFLHKIFKYYSTDSTLKHMIKKKFYEMCSSETNNILTVSKKIDVIYIIYKCCKQHIFLFDYIVNEMTSLDLIIKEHEMNGYADSALYYIFDNYEDPLGKYPINNVNTFNKLLSMNSTTYDTLDELAIYFINHYEHTINYFLEDNVPNIFLSSVRDSLFKKYPELLFSLKFSHYFYIISEKYIDNEYISREKLERMCKLLYIPVELSKHIQINLKDYFNIAVKYNL